MNKKIGLTILLSSFFLISTSYADVNSDLRDFFKGLGYQNNVTSPGAYQGQAAGYYTGGSLYMRNQVKNYQLVSMQLPSFSGGCSGIDTFLGSFSVINMSEAMQMMKKILSAGGAYAMDLALTTAVPQIKSVKDYIQKYVNDINSANINSCNTAEDLVGGMWPKTQASQQQICRDVGSHSGPFSDWAAARQGCGTGGQFNQGINNSDSRNVEKFVNKNLVWYALQQNTFTSNDDQLSELLMSLTGTIIMAHDAKGKPTFKRLFDLVGNEGLIKALLYGGSAQIYGCDEYKKCLSPAKQTITITDENALVSRVKNMIHTLNTDVVNDTGVITPAVRGFLEMTLIPILKFISNETALGQPLDSTQYSEIIAISILNQYFQENINTVEEALSQEDTPMQSAMAKQINSAQAGIFKMLSTALRKSKNTFALINNQRVMERQLSSRLADRASVGQENR